MINHHSIFLVLLLFFSSFLKAQDGEFEYNPAIAKEFGIVALKESFFKNKKDNSLEVEYDIKKYRTYGRYVKDCEGSMQRIIMVTYPSKKENGCAMFLMTYSHDNTAERVIHREMTIETAKDIMDRFKEGNWTEDIFHCGL